MKGAARSRLVGGMVNGAVIRAVNAAVYEAVNWAFREAVSNIPGPAIHETLSQIAGRDVGDSMLRHGR